MANRLLKTGAAIYAASSGDPNSVAPDQQQGAPTPIEDSKPAAVDLTATKAHAQEGTAMSCPTTTQSLTQYHEKFHSNQVCNRPMYDAYKRNLGRHLIYDKFKSEGNFNLVPNQKTIVCPAVVQDLSVSAAAGAAGGVPISGYDTNWIVENTASLPVVLSYVKANGVEVSAVNPSVSPATADPNAILKPGEWKHLHTFDGHVFHAREINPEDGTAGKVLLQHRAGLIGVGMKARPWLTCSKDDPEPVVVQEEPVHATLRDPNFARTPEPPTLKQCNAMDIGFRNMAGCPLDVYWQAPDTCQERFKFHLGTNAYAPDFTWDWESPTKFENTKMGHTFVFKSPSRPDRIVDQVTLAPTRIVDCPDLKQTVAAAVGSKDAVVLRTGEILPTNEGEGGEEQEEGDTGTTPANPSRERQQADYASAFFSAAGPGAGGGSL